ncbi:MAG TPA: chemotaxis protein CheD [Fibrobacteres bacterium]|jgi:chemotaxis protein CheD|nr:chemotaxis protein CheD [Fibrobacterota bacterium]
MKYTVGVSDMKLSDCPGDIIVTHALGSCLGVAIHDPVAGVGGILHYMLPLSQVDKTKSETNPFMFGDTGIPRFFTEAYQLGAVKEKLRIVIAGGAQVFEQRDFFDIGKRNIVIARKLFWKNNILISSEHVGDHIPRTLYLEVGSGKTWFTSHGQTVEL